MLLNTTLLYYLSNINNYIYYNLKVILSFIFIIFININLFKVYFK